MKKILLIEDNADICTNTAEILELSNYKVIVAENGKAGVEKAIACKPDLIICDIMMPELDGYGVLHAVHKNDAIKNTPFIFLTAKTERADQRKGMELGADDYITKPFTGTELLNAVDGRLNKMTQLKQDYSRENTEVNGSKTGLHPDEERIKELTGNRNINHYKNKQLIYSEGNHPNRLYYVVEGKVKACKTNDDGKELVTALYGPGDFLGHVALIEGTTYRDSAKAMCETALAVIPQEDFEAFLIQYPQTGYWFARMLAADVSCKEVQMLGLAYNSLRKKVAEALILMEKKYRRSGEEKFIIDINRECLANIAGTAKESLIRTLSDFRDEKLIRIENDGSILIQDLKKLEQIFG